MKVQGKTVTKVAEPPEFDRCKTLDERLARINIKCARYRNYQNDYSDVDSGKAFRFASDAANEYLPWCVREIRRMRRAMAKRKAG